MDFKKIKKEYVILILICIFGFSLRAVHIKDRFYFNPDPTANHKEAIFLNQYFKWKAAKEESGSDIFSEYIDSVEGVTVPAHSKPVHLELIRLSFILFGKNMDAMSWLGALLGVLSIFLVYKISFLIFKNSYYALLAAFFMAISGYNIFYSGRMYNHVDIVCFSLLVTLFITKLYQENKNKYRYSFLIGLFMGLSFGTHNNSIMAIFIIAIVVFCGTDKFLNKLGIVIFYILGILLPVYFFDIYYRSIKMNYLPMKGFIEQLRNNTKTVDGLNMNIKLFFKYFIIKNTLDGYTATFMAIIGMGLFIYKNFKNIITLKFIKFGPMLYIVGIAMVFFIVWGSYNYQMARTQIFTIWAWPIIAAYALIEINNFIKEKYAEKFKINTKLIFMIAILILSAESIYRTSKLFYLGNGHRKMNEWIIENNIRYAGNVHFSSDKDFFIYPKQDSSGRYKLWYLDIAQVMMENRADYFVIDYPNLYHNYIYNQATHPGSTAFADIFFQALDQFHTPAFEAKYPEPMICQLENGRLWHMGFSAGQKLSKYLRAYDKEAVLNAYSYTVNEMNKRNAAQ